MLPTMSSMLEQAIVDAASLREAAIQSAEQVVVERFSNQIKETVDQILEQDDPLAEAEDEFEDPNAPEELPLPGMATDTADAGQPVADSEESKEAKSFGENAGPDVDEQSIVDNQLDEKDGNAFAALDESEFSELSEEDIIEINLEKILTKEEESGVDEAAETEGLMESKGSFELEEADLEELAEDVEEVQMSEESLEELAEDVDPCSTHACPKFGEEAYKKDDGGCGCKGVKTSLDKSKADKNTPVKFKGVESGKATKVKESLQFDYKAQPSGGPTGQAKPTTSIGDTVQVAEIAAMIEEYNEDLEKENTDLKKENKQLKAKNKNLTGKSKILLESVRRVKEKFDEAQLMNAKLLYTNRVLADTSLNERQTNKIVESINSASSIEQARLVYETLQSGVGGAAKNTPKSLSEVVNKRNSSSILLHSRKREEVDSNNDDFAKRLKRLAGITK